MEMDIDEIILKRVQTTRGTNDLTLPITNDRQDFYDFIGNTALLYAEGGKYCSIIVGTDK